MATTATTGKGAAALKHKPLSARTLAQIVAAEAASVRAWRKAQSEPKGPGRDALYAAQAADFRASVAAAGVPFDHPRVAVWCRRALANIATAERTAAAAAAQAAARADALAARDARAARRTGKVTVTATGGTGTGTGGTVAA